MCTPTPFSTICRDYRMLLAALLHRCYRSVNVDFACSVKGTSLHAFSQRLLFTSKTCDPSQRLLWIAGTFPGVPSHSAFMVKNLRYYHIKFIVSFQVFWPTCSTLWALVGLPVHALHSSFVAAYLVNV